MIKAISTIIGTFIGAGFASGKEIYLFFYRYGIWGIIGIIISSLTIGYIIFKVINISKNNEINNYNNFIDYIIKNKIIKIILNNIIEIFLIISFCVMISGFCAFLKQEFNIKIIISYICILIFCYIILRKNINGIAKINNILIPLIIFTIIFITLKNVDNPYTILQKNIINNNLNFKFIIDSILYANYNLLTIIPILITIKNFITKKRNIKYVSLLCTSIILVLSISIFTILSQGNSNLKNIEMPIVYIVREYGLIYKYIYCLIIGISIFTTAISAGYGYLQKYENNRKKYNKRIIFLMISTIISIPIGFSKLIEILYPVFGFIGLIQSYYIIKMRTKLK
ncbi:MAG: hypothetical protein J6A89_07865 [Clostridia bacterium]|nr:hypothetical protein [Clostridia bacterium]